MRKYFPVFIKQSLLLIAAAILIALLNFLLNANRPEIGSRPDEITFEEYAKFSNEHILVDARSGEEFAQGSVDTALNLSPENFDEGLGKLLDSYSPEKIIIIFCDSSACDTSRNIAERLRNECGLKNIFIFKDDWRKLRK